MKPEGLNTIRACAHVCKLLKARGMLRAIREGERNSKTGIEGGMARGSGSTHACETYERLPLFIDFCQELLYM
jgi:hypothetical protein